MNEVDRAASNFGQADLFPLPRRSDGATSPRQRHRRPRTPRPLSSLVAEPESGAPPHLRWQQKGYEVTVMGRTAATLEQTVKLINDAGGSARYVIADVHDEQAVRHAVEIAASHSGRLDVAVNSAGVDGGNDSHPLRHHHRETTA